ncbi:amidase family protein [Fodinicola acaciae]|uniref:amidase family protein n=1 Tax=Fodinicola acaciae TaxID=2681555 RepID=UPI001C9E3F36|nr:amidase family protein [Fodinicola acaciae]
MTDWQAWSEQAWRRHSAAAVSCDQTLTQLAFRSAQAFPDRVAVRIDGVALTHGELDRAAAAVAADLDVRAGDRVLLAGPSTVDFVVAYLGILRAGGVVVLANPAHTAAELAHLVADSGATHAFASAEVAERLPDLPVTLLDPDRRNRNPIASPVAVPSDPDAVALLAYTSGTTGKPKGVPLTHRNLVASISAAMAAWRFTADDVLVHALPLFHQHGLGGIHATLIAGSTAVMLSRFSPTELAKAAAGATALFAVPTMYERLCEAGQSLPGLRLCVCGSAPLSPALAERTAKLLGQLPLVRYGTTESGLDVSNPLDDPRPDTVGIPLPGVSCRLSADGEIQLRGPQVFRGYWQNEEATAEAFTADGWFRTGDLGRLDDGHLVIAGRIKELIITGGLNVYPREVELALEAHPAVAEAAVAGVPDERWGEQVTGFVVVRDEVSEDELIDHLRSRLTAYKCPKRIYRLSALPRNHMGKVVRGSLTPALAAVHRARDTAHLGAFVEVVDGVGHGVPLAVKDLVDVAGQTVRNGTPGLGHRTATEDAEVFARLRESGYVAIGRTRVPELAWSTLTPGCRNPWDPARTPGGSSGGSAVAVATGVVTAAIGTDTGGSIRIPAALCGVAGLRPTHGVLPMRGITALSPSMDTVGPIALTAAECLRLYEIMGGAVEPVSDVDGLRVGWPVDLWDGKAEPEVHRLVEDAADVLRAAGVEILEVSLPVARRFARGAAYATMLVESARLWWEASQQVPDGLGSHTTSLLRTGSQLSTSDFANARRQAADVRSEVDGVLGTVAALLLPTVPAVAAPSAAATIRLGDRDEAVESAYFRLTAMASTTGHPALSVPAGLTIDGLPVGAQLVGGRRQEARLCQLGTIIEAGPSAQALAVARRRLAK